MLVDFSQKLNKGDFFVKLCKVFLGQKHIYTLQMIPPSTKDCAGILVKIESSEVKLESGVETKEDKIEINNSYADIVIHRESVYRG